VLFYLVCTQAKISKRKLSQNDKNEHLCELVANTGIAFIISNNKSYVYVIGYKLHSLAVVFCLPKNNMNVQRS